MMIYMYMYGAVSAEADCDKCVSLCYVFGLFQFVTYNELAQLLLKFVKLCHFMIFNTVYGIYYVTFAFAVESFCIFQNWDFLDLPIVLCGADCMSHFNFVSVQN